MKVKITREQELELFRRVCSSKRIITSQHENISYGNRKKDAIYNQQISLAKLRDFVNREGIDFNGWQDI